MIQELNIPEERKAVVIGKNGNVKEDIEKRSHTSITVSDGIVIEGDDPLMVMKVSRVVRAIGRGFSPDKALLLLNEDYELKVINLRGETENTIKRLMARVIGRSGSTRKILEKRTNCLISVYGKTVSLIGKDEEIPIAERAVNDLLGGRSHGYVYSKLRR